MSTFTSTFPTGDGGVDVSPSGFRSRPAIAETADAAALSAFFCADDTLSLDGCGGGEPVAATGGFSGCCVTFPGCSPAGVETVACGGVCAPLTGVPPLSVPGPDGVASVTRSWVLSLPRRWPEGLFRPPRRPRRDELRPWLRSVRSPTRPGPAWVSPGAVTSGAAFCSGFCSGGVCVRSSCIRSSLGGVSRRGARPDAWRL